MNAKMVFVSLFFISNQLFSQVSECRVTECLEHDAMPLVTVKEQTNNPNTEQLYSEKDYVIAFCQQYAPSYVSLLQTSYSSPNNWTVSVGGVVQANDFDAQKKEDIIDEFESIIHESTHHKNAFNGFLIDPFNYLVLSNEENQIADKFFNSDLIEKVVSAEAQEQLFRYKTYVSKQSKVGANVQGIIGLMDEYSAYQNGCSAALMAYDNALKNKDTTLAITFFKEALQTHFAYYEFNIFIGAYVKYARLYNSEVYQQILKLTTLRQAYSLNTKCFLNSLQIIQTAQTRLKRNYREVKFLIDYYNTKNVTFAKEYMKNIETDLQVLKSTP
jgi:hypothetical protein